MIITFMSDFGTEDGYTGSVKGVLLNLAPQATVVDITHAIPPFDIKRAAYTLLNYFNSFPSGTVHLIVVDPGVGSQRKPLILQTDDYFFVGPDNGIFDLLQYREKYKIWRILEKKVNPKIDSATFHGRDLFAPAAAMLANGVSPQTIGKKETAANPKPTFVSLSGNRCNVPILAVDHFGNIITALHRNDLNRLQKSIKWVAFKNFKTDHIQKYYAEAQKGEPLALWNSLDFLEIAVREASAARYFKVNAQKESVTVELKDHI